ncbi:MAG TPA: hypothetical protein VGN16_23515 [Acidobacteriaceae bacterium]|jgi:hypothetical protein
MAAAALPTFSPNRSAKFTALFQNQSQQLKSLAQEYCSLSVQREAKAEARLKILESILKALAFPAIGEPQQKLIAAALKLADGGKTILTKQGINYDALMVKIAVEAEIRAIAGAPDRWRRMRGFVGNPVGRPRVSGPPLLLLSNDPGSIGFMREVYDPKHRGWGQQDGMSPQQDWDREKAGSLFDWADGQQAAGKYANLGNMKYMSAQEAALCELRFDGGTLLNPKGERYSTGMKWEIFVMDRNAHFYIGTHIPSRLHHSSFLSGGPVKCAGELMVTDGVLVGISDRSGHYRPDSAHIITLLRTLKFICKVPLEKVKLEIYKRDQANRPIPAIGGFEIVTLNALEVLQNWQQGDVVKRWKEFKK